MVGSTLLIPSFVVPAMGGSQADTAQVFFCWGVFCSDGR